MKTFLMVALLAICVGIPLSADAQFRSERVHFQAGASGATVQGRIVGRESVGYVVNAGDGQRMTASLSTDNAFALFNVYAPGRGLGDETLFAGSREGTVFAGTLADAGDYLIVVFLNRNAARRDETANYELTVTIGDAVAPQIPAPDYADGLMGGPDWWQVTGVSRGSRLNIREGPSISNRIVTQVPDGFVLRNLGCVRRSQTWCDIEAADGSFTGWAASRYLRESAAPHAPDVATPQRQPDLSRAIPELIMRSTGEIEVHWPNACIILYSPSGRVITSGLTCDNEQRVRSDDAVVRYRREQADSDNHSLPMDAIGLPARLSLKFDRKQRLRF